MKAEKLYARIDYVAVLLPRLYTGSHVRGREKWAGQKASGRDVFELVLVGRAQQR